MQSDGKVVLAGAHSVTPTNTLQNALIRLNADGSLDSTFGSGGIVLNKLPANTQGYSRVLIQSDGKIVAAGTTSGTTSPTTFNTVSNLTLDAVSDPIALAEEGEPRNAVHALWHLGLIC